jgi:hypothetical protein
VDAPRDRDGRIIRPALLRALESELRILWTDLKAQLPPAEDAQIGQHSDAGRSFWSAMRILWQQTATFEVARGVEGTSGETVAARSSLVGRVRTAAKEYISGRITPGKREKWREVQRSFCAWWRPCIWPDGQLYVALAMRFELCRQINVELPGVRDQVSLTNLGEQFGVLAKSPPVPVLLSGGKSRLAVLSLELTQDLLEQPPEEMEVMDSVTE